jgi:hypothetical protein
MGVVIESYALPRGSFPRTARVPQFVFSATVGRFSAHHEATRIRFTDLPPCVWRPAPAA